jgi:SNF2 family DNA or RNA helicase
LLSVPIIFIAAKCPYLGENKSFEGCHLIVVPGTILNQWVSEIRIFLNPKAFDLFTYQSGEDFREDFWSESGSFAQSKQPRANRIILATHSVCIAIFASSGRLLFVQALSQEFKLLFLQLSSSKKELPWRKPRRVATYDSMVQKTIFGLNFLSVTIDEAHEFRNVGLKHSAALEILRNAQMRLIMTATPLQTSTKARSNFPF